MFSVFFLALRHAYLVQTKRTCICTTKKACSLISLSKFFSLVCVNIRDFGVDKLIATQLSWYTSTSLARSYLCHFPFASTARNRSVSTN